MSLRPWPGLIRSWLSRGWVLYAALAIVMLFLVDARRLSAHAKPVTLSRLRPDYTYIGGFAKGIFPLDRKSLEDQRVYLENVNAIMSERPDADSLLAYVYYLLGEKSQAEELFVRASRLNPTFFWNYFDLGVLTWSRGDSDKASSYLQTAVDLNPELSIKFFVTSRIFLPLVVEAGYSPPMFQERLFAGYAEAYKILVMIEYSGHKYAQALAYARAGIRYSHDAKDQAYFYYYIGASALRMNVFPVAVKAFEETIKLYPEHPEALASMGLLLKTMGQETAAAEVLQQAKVAAEKNGSALPKSDDFKVGVF